MTKTCGKCNRYSYKVSRCLDGKVNPRSLKDTVEVITFIGLSAICLYSKWRSKAIQAKAKAAPAMHSTHSMRLS